MNFESYQAKTEAEPALDEELFARYQKFDIPVLPNIKPDSETLISQKEAFLKGEIDCPELKYSKVLEVDFEAKEKGLLELKSDLKNSENFGATEQAYVWSINERLAKLRMLKELAEVQGGEDVEVHQKRFKRYTEFIYGKPEPEIFNSVLISLQNKIQKVDNVSNLAALENLSKLTNNINTEKDFNFPNITRPELVEDVVDTAEEVKLYFENAISEIGLDGWKVVIEQENTESNLSVTVSKRIVNIPNSENLKLRPEERKLTLSMIKGLILHELGTHALRNNNGLRSRLKLLSVGLDRYEIGEEGLATYREQQETGADDFSGFDNYFAAGLAYGLDGGPERDFGQVFAILKDYYEVCDGATKEKAQQLAFNRCVRVFRGTPANVPGLIFTKDTIYRKGNIETYNLSNTELFEKIDLNVGKFDPSNSRHLMLLVELGILDKDLEFLNNQI